MENAGELQKQERLRNQWEPSDPRMKDCLELSGKMADILDCSQSGNAADNLTCEKLCKPLELAEAMREAATKLELLTEQAELPEEVVDTQ